MLNVNSFILLLCLLAACNQNQSSVESQSQLSDSTLIAILEGFDSRMADYFGAQEDIPLAGKRGAGCNDAQRHSYPRIEYATVNFLFNQNIDSVNIALVEYADYFINDPEKVLHRDYFHWHSEISSK